MLKLGVLGAAMLAAVACGGDDGSGPNNPPAGGDTTLTASLSDGPAFTAVAANISVFANRVFITATNGANVTLGLSFDLQTGVQFSGTAGTATASFARQGSGSWGAGAANSGSSGQVSLTTATANRIAGSFNFNMVGLGNNVPATIQLTNGRIDIRY